MNDQWYRVENLSMRDRLVLALIERFFSINKRIDSPILARRASLKRLKNPLLEMFGTKQSNDSGSSSPIRVDEFDSQSQMSQQPKLDDFDSESQVSQKQKLDITAIPTPQMTDETNNNSNMNEIIQTVTDLLTEEDVLD